MRTTVHVMEPPSCHPERQHYSRGLCKSCHQTAWENGTLEEHPRRLRKLAAPAITCDHNERPKIANGLCSACYQSHRYAQSKSIYRRYQLKAKYSLKEGDYQAMIVAQNGRCSICHLEGILNIDHDHKTGQVRGLLCDKCNIMIGYAKENDITLEQAALYLKISRAMPSSRERELSLV